jgi:hypothetical protein
MASPIAGMAAQINKAFTNIFFDATLRRETESGSGDSYSFTTASYPCKGLVETFSMALRRDGIVSENERKIMILVGSLSVIPKSGDLLIINNGTEFVLLEVATDPANAVWECKGRM